MRPASQKQKIIIASSLSILIAWLFYFLVTPASAYALTIEPVYKVLQTAGPVKDVWKNVRNMINVLVIAALIFIAFANILRINLNNYAIKKFLPALIFGIVAANFSYFICQFLVDIANVAMSLLMNGAGGSANGSVTDIGVGGAFGLTQEIDTANLWKSFVYVVAEFAGAVVIFILAFLFLIRNYIIYFTVVLSPLAFMCTAIPETKTVFKQWSGWFIKWTFMPIVSIFWLWLGALWYNAGMKSQVAAGDFNAYLLAIVFAGVCYYLAITTPFKMGGAQMAMMGKLGKGALGLAGTVTGARAGWNYLKERNKTNWAARGINIQNAFKDATGIGKGLDAAKQKLDDANKSRSSIQDEAKGEYIKKAGDRRAQEQMRNMSRDGSSAYEEAIAMEHFVKNPDYKAWIDKKRYASAEGKTKMAVAQKALEIENLEMEKRFSGMFTEDGKEIYAKDEKGEYIKDEDGHFKVAEGMEEEAAKHKKKQKFFEGYARTLQNAENLSEEVKKLYNDPVKNVYFERVQLDNIAEERKNADKLHADLEKLIALTERTEENGSEWDAASARLIGAGYDISNSDRAALESQFRPQLGERKRRAEANYQHKVETIQKQMDEGGGAIPVALEGLVELDSTGKVASLKSMGNIERSRAAKRVSSEITDDASAAIQKWSTEERLQSLKVGNQVEGFNAKNLEYFFEGQKAKNSAKTNFTIESFIKSTTVPTSQNNVEGNLIADSKLQLLDKHDKTGEGHRELADAVNRNIRADVRLRAQLPEIDTSSAATIQAGIDRVRKHSQNAFKHVANGINSNRFLGHGGMSSTHG